MDIGNQLKVALAKMEFGQKNKQAFLQVIAELLNYGISMFAVFNEVLTEIYPKGGMAYIVHDISEQVAMGKDLSECLAFWYGPKVAAIIKSGEASNNLYESLKLATVAIDSSNNYFAVFMKSIFYSLSVFLGSLGILALYSLKIMPAIMPFLKGKFLPPVVSGYISYYQFMISYDSLITAGVLAMIGAALAFFITHYTGPNRAKLEQLPLFKMYRQVVGATILEQVSFYFRAQILLDKAIKNISDSSRSPYLKMHCDLILQKIDEGVNNVAYAFDTGLFDKSITSVMFAMGRVNRFEEKCADYSKSLKNNVIAVVQRVGKVFSLLFMILATLNIGWSILAMYSALQLLM